MKPRYTFLLLVVSLAAFAWIGYAVQQHAPGGSAPAKSRKVLYYQDSMHPWIKSDHPGKCTVCSMDLTPIFEGDKGFEVNDQTAVLSSNSVTVLNVQAEEVKRQSLSRVLRVAGTLEADESRKTIISAPAPCRIQAVGIQYTGVEVEKGHPLVTLFSPELVQKRGYLQAVSALMPGLSNDLAQASRRSDAFSTDLVAPQRGTVIERNVFKGQYVPEGEKLFTLVDSSVLWFRFDIYQRQLPWVEPGQTVEVTVEGVPGKVFPGVVSFIEPTVNEATRTVKVRADISNPVVATNVYPRRLLRLGMYAEGTLSAKIPNLLAVPRSAILFPGNLAYAYVDLGNGAYERRRVKLGREGDGLWEILQGLEEGDRVVTTGNVLVDAQVQFNREAKPEEVGAGEVAANSAATIGLGREDPSPAAASSAAPVETSQPDMTAPPAMPSGGHTAMSGMGTNAGAPPLARPLGSARRSQMMSAVMSPGGELQMARRAAIAAELANQSAMGTSASGSPSSPMPARITNAIPYQPVSQVGLSNRVPAAGSGVQTYREMDRARVALRDEMRLTRQTLIAEAHARKAAETNALSATQRQALETFLAGADRLSQALAADDLDQVKKSIANLPEVLAPMRREFGTPHRWSASVERLGALPWPPAKDLGEARKQFLPFSSATVELVKQLRQEDPAFRSLKVYHCPMAPKPGLWMQAKGPLRNPFYGSEMLECGKEVTP